MTYRDSELIFNQDGSVYHLKLKPENISDDIILVGDPFRVDLISKHFDKTIFEIQNREFKTVTGLYNSRKITVLSTGIGSGNIDIVINELDALVNIDFNTRKLKDTLKTLNFIRIGTSGAIQNYIDIDTILVSKIGVDIDGFLNNYDCSNNFNTDLSNKINDYANKQSNRLKPLCFDCSKVLYNKYMQNSYNDGVTLTCNGFYGSQGRSIRIKTTDQDFIQKFQNFKYNNLSITNLEMETAIIYGLSNLLGHNAISLNAILANRITGKYSLNPEKTMNNLITNTLNKF